MRFGFRVSEDKGQREEENGKIPNHKNQMTNKYQIPIINDQNNCTAATQVPAVVSNIGILVIGYCLGFVICIL